MPVVFFAMLLSGGGLGAGLVRRAGTDQDAESTVFWFSLALGFGLAACLLVLSEPLSIMLDEPRVAALLCAISPIVILSSLCTVPQARLTRDGQLMAFAASDLASALGGMAIAFFGAWQGWGPWSLIAQQLVLWVIKFVMVFKASRLRVRFVLAMPELLAMVRFGSNVMGANLVDFCTRNVDIYVIHMSSGIRDLGYYSIAMQIVRMPDTVLTGPIFTMLFPVLARASHDHARMKHVYLGGLRAVVLMVVPTMVGLAAIGPLLVQSVLGSQWTLAGTLLAVLMPVGLAKCMFAVNSALFLGAGRSDMTFRFQLAVAAALLAGIAVGALFGVMGVAVGYAAVSLAAIPASYVVVTRILPLSLKDILAVFGPASAASAAMLTVVVTMIHLWRPDTGSVTVLALSIIVGAVSYGASLATISGRRLYAEFKTFRHMATGM